ncbi:MAG TPA: adenylyl-sulfate reductase [Gammaproteobacteria bacterium]|nr:adenylyl-sulfate reductase [Gammaproteobacteria bacterium]
MQAYVIVMFLLVIGGTVLDMMHKKSAQYFFENAKKAEKSAKHTVSSGEKTSMAIQTVTSEVLTSSEFANPKRRLSHLFMMYGFIIFLVTTAIMIFSGSSSAIISLLWHLGALSVCIGGYWFWFSIRVDVNSEGKNWYELCRADLFIVSLLATVTFALIWSIFGSVLLFALFIASSTVLFGGVYFSKFAHMFFKPAAAYQKRITKADGSRENLPGDYDLTDPAVQAKFPDIPEYMGNNPPNMGLGIKRESPNHY